MIELVSDDPTVVEVIEASYGIFRPDGDPAIDRAVAARLRVERTGSDLDRERRDGRSR